MKMINQRNPALACNEGQSAIFLEADRRRVERPFRRLGMSSNAQSKSS